MKKRFAALVLFFSCSLILRANTINVPADQPKIQTAIEAASDGDTILVSPGTYFENINFHEKNLFLTSYYIIDHDTSYIRQTIINGSTPNHPDTASCIIIIGEQDSTTVVQGFTITGGKGTSWKDEHSAGTYREGGGIIVAESSPIIRYNLITGNEAINSTGLYGSGGGGIRCGDGEPKILNNLIFNNKGHYGGGLVSNYCAATIRNNIIVNNEGGEEYGGGGVWINGNISVDKQNILENNTIVNNHSFKGGGGILFYNGTTKGLLKNNIIYGNTQVFGKQIAFAGATVPVTYCDIEDILIAGTGNIYNSPDFIDTMFYLGNNSPCIDGGDTNSKYNDLADTNAIFPSNGTMQNDMGAYGGPEACIFPFFEYSKIRLNDPVTFGYRNIVGINSKQKRIIANQSTFKRSIDSVVVMYNKENVLIDYSPSNILNPCQTDSIIVKWTPVDVQPLVDTIIIYFETSKSEKPLKIPVTGSAKLPTEIKDIVNENLIENYPNPFSDNTTITYNCSGNQASLSVYTIDGKIIKTYKSLNPSGSILFDGSKLPSGIYFYKLITSDHKVIANKMVIQR